MSDVQRLLSQLASSVAGGETGPYVFLVVDGVRISGVLIGRKRYLEEMREVAQTLPDGERGMFEAAFVGLETGADLLDTLYLQHARINDQVAGTWCVAIAAVGAAAVLVG